MLLPPIFSILTLFLFIPAILAAPKKHPPPPPTEDTIYQYRQNPTIINELDISVPCRNVSLIHARGSHSKGNVGYAAVFFDYLARRISYDAVAVQGLEYPASYSDYWWRKYDKGIKETLRQLSVTMDRCPNTTLILSGYSQGAQVVRKTADHFSDEEAAFVQLVILWGDPDKMPDGPNGEVRPPVGPLNNHKILEICHPKDRICHHHKLPHHDHRNYFLHDGEMVADWIVQHLNISQPGGRKEMSKEMSFEMPKTSPQEEPKPSLHEVLKEVLGQMP